MRLARNPELLDRLAAQYALGVLRGGARRRMEAHAGADHTVRAAILQWQARLSGLAELQASAEPVDKVWCGIESRLGWKAVPAAAAPPRAASWWQHLWGQPAVWRGAAAAMAMVALLAIGLGWQAARQVTAPAVLAVLNDEQARPAMLVTRDAATNTLTLRRLDHMALTDRQALQLWSLPPGGKPRSLGVLGRARDIQLPLPRELAGALAVSVEPVGGSPDPAGPSGPVVFQGAVIPGAL